MPDYLVIVTTTPAAAESKPIERLVRAKTQAQAIAHVVDPMIAVKIADTEDAIRIGKLEHAK